MKFFKTIKFKLILWFGFLLMISTFNTLVVVNYSLQEYYRSTAPQIITFVPNTKIFDENVRTKIIEQIEHEREEIKLRVFLSSLIAILLQIAIAIAGSYFVIMKLLSPLKELNRLMNDLNEKMLYIKLDAKGNSEEINELSENFNNLMERLNKMFTSQKQFVENVSHEIKTPLTVIKTNLEAVKYDTKISKNELDDAIKTSINSINFLNKLVEDLMLLSFIDKKSIELEKVKIYKILQKVKKDSSSLTKEKHLEINIEELGEEISIKANPILLHRSLANIVENAIKYSPKESEINIRYFKINNHVEIQISDQGQGIPKKFRKKIFERFFRIDKSRSRETGGTGLGLAITKEIIKNFGGEIEIKNNTPGTTFIIKLLANNE